MKSNRTFRRLTLVLSLSLALGFTGVCAAISSNDAASGSGSLDFVPDPSLTRSSRLVFSESDLSTAAYNGVYEARFTLTKDERFWKCWMRNSGDTPWTVVVHKGSPNGEVVISGTAKANSTYWQYSKENSNFAAGDYYLVLTCSTGTMEGEVACRIASSFDELEVPA